MRKGWFGIWIWRLAAVAASLVALFLALRIHLSDRQPDLRPWHTWAPEEPDPDQLDWAGWIAAEDGLFRDLQTHMRTELAAVDRVAANRYFEESPVNPQRFAENWNRSYTLLPAGPPRGAVVLLHGLSDSPYSLRHVAKIYVDHGFAAVALRLPGHGTVPAGLVKAHWQDWRAATRLAMREARRLAGDHQPLHLVGYSNGGALALQYTLDSLEEPSLAPVARVVLLSPMIGLTRFARFAGVAGWPSILPSFSKTAWLDLVPEFNPFKYGSFPVNAARQSYELTQIIDRQMLAAVKSGSIARMPPLLVFQSVVDSTVAGEAVFQNLFSRLPGNGSEIVLFDVNRAAPLDLLLSPTALGQLERMKPTGPQPYRFTFLANEPGNPFVSEHTRPPSSTAETVRALNIEYPATYFSLSHVALPFPPQDSLYGTHPVAGKFGVHLGNQLLRAERGTLLSGADSLVRASCNPFFDYQSARIAEHLRAADDRGGGLP